VTFSSKGIINTNIQPTISHGVKLRVASMALRFSSGSSSSSLFFSAAATSRTSLSSRSSSTIRYSFSIAFFSRSARPLALSANDCHSTTRSSATLQSCTIKQTSNMSWATYRQCIIDGDDASP
jgi:hypothetical protein